MINRILRYFRYKKWRSLPWKSMGTFEVGKNFTVINPDKIELGNSFSAENNLRLQAWTNYLGQTFEPSIKIGEKVSMMENCQISCCSNVTIGDGCLFGANVFVTDNFHGDNSLANKDIPPLERPLLVKGGVKIGRNVWIGRNVCIMPNVNIGDNVIIGANSVVTHDIADDSVAAGVPARVIKEK